MPNIHNQNFPGELGQSGADTPGNPYVLLVDFKTGSCSVSKDTDLLTKKDQQESLIFFTEDEMCSLELIENKYLLGLKAKTKECETQIEKIRTTLELGLRIATGCSKGPWQPFPTPKPTLSQTHGIFKPIEEKPSTTSAKIFKVTDATLKEDLVRFLDPIVIYPTQSLKMKIDLDSGAFILAPRGRNIDPTQDTTEWVMTYLSYKVDQWKADEIGNLKMDRAFSQWRPLIIKALNWATMVKLGKRELADKEFSQSSPPSLSFR